MHGLAAQLPKDVPRQNGHLMAMIVIWLVWKKFCCSLFLSLSLYINPNVCFDRLGSVGLSGKRTSVYSWCKAPNVRKARSVHSSGGYGTARQVDTVLPIVLLKCDQLGVLEPPC